MKWYIFNLNYDDFVWNNKIICMEIFDIKAEKIGQIKIALLECGLFIFFLLF